MSILSPRGSPRPLGDTGPFSPCLRRSQAGQCHPTLPACPARPCLPRSGCIPALARIPAAVNGTLNITAYGNHISASPTDVSGGD